MFACIMTIIREMGSFPEHITVSLVSIVLLNVLIYRLTQICLRAIISNYILSRYLYNCGYSSFLIHFV